MTRQITVGGTMKVFLGGIFIGSVVFIPDGLPHCNWNPDPGPGSETHSEMIIQITDHLEQIACMVEEAEEVPLV